MSKVEELLVEEDPACPVSPGDAVTKKKKKKKKEKKEKKEKKKKKAVDDVTDSLADAKLYETPGIEKKKKATLDPSFVSPIGISSKLLDTPGANSKRSLALASKDLDKWSVEYFTTLLEEIRAKCNRKLKIKERDRENFISSCEIFYDTWQEKQENDQYLTELLEGNHVKKKKGPSTEELVKTQTEVGNDLDVVLNQRKRKCIKSALSVFMGLDEESLIKIQEVLVKGAIIAQSTPQRLANFASKSKRNKKLLKRLFSDNQLMKEMLLHGGAAKYEYGEAIRIFVECMEAHKGPKKKPVGEAEDYVDEEDFEEDDWSKVHRKIALACALELASPVREFDTAINIDPVARYKHFVAAHKAGELDPAFPYFSIWEMRQIVNCDAPNDQMTWCRKMVSVLVMEKSCCSVKTCSQFSITRLSLSDHELCAAFDVFDRRQFAICILVALGRTNSKTDMDWQSSYVRNGPIGRRQCKFSIRYILCS